MDAMLQFVFDYLSQNHTASWFYHMVSFVIFLIAGIRFVLWPAGLWCWKAGQKVYGFFTGINDTVQTVIFLKKELQPNGGSTLKDSINRIDNEIRNIKHLVTYSCAKQGAFFDFLGYVGNDGIGLFEANSEGECVHASPKYYEITGSTEQDVTGNGWINLLDEKDRDRVYHEWSACIAQKRPFIMEYNIINRKTNEKISVSCYAKPLVEQGKFLGYIGGLRRLSCLSAT